MVFRLVAATSAAVVLLASICPALCWADQVTYNLTPLSAGLPSDFAATLSETGEGYVAADGGFKVDFEFTASGPAVTSVYFNWDPTNAALNASLDRGSGTWTIPVGKLATSSNQSVSALAVGSFSASLTVKNPSSVTDLVWSVVSPISMDASSFAASNVPGSYGPQMVAAGVLNGEVSGWLSTPASVPEPAELIAMYGIGGMGLIGWVWRRRRAGRKA